MKKIFLFIMALAVVSLTNAQNNEELELLSFKVKKIRELFQNTNEGSQEEQKLLLKWKELSTQQIPLIKTTVDAYEVFDNAPNDSEVRKTAEQILKKFLLKDLASAVTVEQVNDVDNFMTMNDDSVLNKARLETWVRVAKTVEELEDSYRAVEVYSNPPQDMPFKKAIYNKWKIFYPSLSEVKKQYLKEQSIVDMGNSGKYYSEKRELLFKRWVDLAESFDELVIVYRRTLEGSEEEQIVAKKMAAYVQKK